MWAVRSKRNSLGERPSQDRRIRGKCCDAALTPNTLLFDNTTANLPVSFDHRGIDRADGFGSGLGEDATHVGEKVGGWCDFFSHGAVHHRQQFLYFFPLPQAQGALREIFGGMLMMLSGLAVFLMSL